MECNLWEIGIGFGHELLSLLFQGVLYAILESATNQDGTRTILSLSSHNNRKAPEGQTFGGFSVIVRDPGFEPGAFRVSVECSSQLS